MPFEPVVSWAFPPMTEYGDTFEPDDYKDIAVDVRKINYDYLVYIYPKAETLEKYKPIALRFLGENLEDTYKSIIRNNFTGAGLVDVPYFHFRYATKDESNFRSAEQMYSEYNKNGFISGECTKNASWINFLCNSINIPSKNIIIDWSYDEEHRDITIFTDSECEFHQGKISETDASYVSPIIIEFFDSEGNIKFLPIIYSHVLHLGNIDKSLISPVWFEEQIYQTWKNRWKK